MQPHLTAEEIAAYVDQTASAELKARVDRHLNEDRCDQCTQLVDERLAEAVRIAEASTTPQEASDPTRIGSYAIKGRLGKGGYGQVFLGIHTELRAPRALKILKENSEGIRKRFDLEKIVLALMDHENVAVVHECGTVEKGKYLGHPYFVLDYVPGQHITDYCNDRRLGIEERLRTFMKVCHGIHHAHQKGIIHRDIKPSNVMANDRSVKVIDFGVAKTLQPVVEKGQTQPDRPIGTYGYMAPEQIRSRGQDIDTRCDVYALGVLLYELLTGQRLYPEDEIKDMDIFELVEFMRQERKAPSTRLGSSSGDSRIAIENFGVDDPTLLVRKVKSDLDRITMKCLQFNREERYDSALALARNIERYLKGEPVDPPAPGWTYVWRKLIWVHRKLVAGALVGLIGLLIVTGLAVKLHFTTKEKNQSIKAMNESDAVRLFEEAKRLVYWDRQKGEEKLAQAIDKDPDHDEYVIYRLFLYKRQDRKQKEIRAEANRLLSEYPERHEPYILIGEPEKAEAKLQAWKYKYYCALAVRDGEPSEAIELLEESLEDKPWDFDVNWELAVRYHAAGQYEKMFKIAELLTKERPELGLTWELKGAALKQLGRLKQAIECFDEAIRWHVLPYWLAHYNRATAEHELAVQLKDSGDHDQASALFEQALGDYTMAIDNEPGEDDPDPYYGRGITLYFTSQFIAARRDIEQALALGYSKPAAALERLGMLLLILDEYEEAYQAFDQEIDLDPDWGAAKAGRGIALWFKDKGNEASRDFDTAFNSSPGDYVLLCLWIWEIRMLNGQTEAAKAALDAAEKTTPNAFYRTIVGHFCDPETESKEDVLLAANNMALHQCEAYYYLGVKALIDGKRREAKSLFRQCMDTDVVDAFEFILAKWHLQKMGRDE